MDKCKGQLYHQSPQEKKKKKGRIEDHPLHLDNNVDAGYSIMIQNKSLKKWNNKK